MSNLNPHGHISQSTQNPTWNHLQIPSYIPRQPQLAHMSNERPMVRSPSPWHAPPAPPDSIYNFMSANHKNLEHSMNSLLPPFVRGPPPFDSMDLSLQSSRSSTSPLNKNLHPSVAVMAAAQHEYVHKQAQQQQQQHHSHQHQQAQQQQQQQQQQSQIHTQNNYPIHNLSAANSPSNIGHSHQQQQQQQQMHASMSTSAVPTPPSQQQQQQHTHSGGMQQNVTSTQSLAPPPPTSSPVVVSSSSSNVKYLNSNGNDCETMLPPPITSAAVGGSVSGSGGGISSAGNNNNGGGPSSAGPSPQHYTNIRETDARINENYTKMSQMNRGGAGGGGGGGVSNYDNELQSNPLQKPVELVKQDCNYPPIMSNKLPTHQQQVSPKKHSPIRNYGQQQPQQQQQPSSYNNPNAPKHNGPHTPPPPTPQSPVMHQQQPAGSNAVMDYNQLHLQQQQQNNYGHQQQQQQHLPPHIQQQHLHYSHHHPHHHHIQQQQQQQQHHAAQQHINPALHHHIQHHPQQQQHVSQTHQQQQQQHQSQHLHQQQQQQQHSSPMHTQHANLTHLDAYSRNDTKHADAPNVERTTISDLSSSTPPALTSASSTIYKQHPGIQDNCIPDSAESPDDVASSNDESIDSNSNSSVCRLRNKPTTTSKMTRASSNESENDNVSVALQQLHQQQDEEQQEMPSTKCSSNNNSRSPKTSSLSPQQKQLKKLSSPGKAQAKSPISLDAVTEQRIADAPVIEVSPTPIASTIPPPILHKKTAASECNDENDKSQSRENGCLSASNSAAAAAAAAADEVETIDKIAEMIAKTSNDTTNSNSSMKSTDHDLCGSVPVASPKTKKQRQALKLRNAEHNSNSNCSTNSYNETVNTAANDNAVLADELRKDSSTHGSGSGVGGGGSGGGGSENINMESASPTLTATPHSMRPLSPQTHSRSSSSGSSSSSSCSNSSRSSSKSHKTKAAAAADAGSVVSIGGGSSSAAAAVAAAAAVIMEKENVCGTVGDMIQVQNTNKDVVDSTQKEDYVNVRKQHQLNIDEPLNLNNKKDIGENTNPAKSRFEEVENKLEEMFAGIEDEPSTSHEAADDVLAAADTPVTAAGCADVHNLSLAFELSTNGVLDNAGGIHTKVSPPPLPLEELKKPEGPPPTKAAKKSTIPSPIKPSTPTPPSPAMPTTAQSPAPATNKIVENYKSPAAAAAAAVAVAALLPKKLAPLRSRRLSVVMDRANLRITMDDSDSTSNKGAENHNNNNTNSKELIVHLDDELPSTSAAAIAALAAKSADVASGGVQEAGGAYKESTTKNSSSSKKDKGRSNGRKRVMSQTKGGSGGGGNGGCGSSKFSKGSKHAKNAKLQKQRRRQNSSDDETSAPLRESSNTEQKYKSPFILVKRDGSISVINAPTAEDINEKQTKAKKPIGYAHDRKNIRGLHSSTLSTKYDADTTDSTWICVFCKRGPHKMALGDLFGPYLVSIDCEEYKAAIKAPDALDLDAVFATKRRRIDMVKFNERNLPVMPMSTTKQTQAATTTAAAAAALALAAANRMGMNKKKKKSISIDETSSTGSALSVNTDPLDCSNETVLHETFLGMCKTTESSYEVWLHEDCIVWAPDVFLVGARVMGLDTAVWTSTRYQCVLCSKPGAVVCCLQRDCKAAAHAPCAREAHWNLDESNLKVYCNKHAAGTATSTASTPASSAATPILSISGAYS